MTPSNLKSTIFATLQFETPKRPAQALPYFLFPQTWYFPVRLPLDTELLSSTALRLHGTPLTTQTPIGPHWSEDASDASHKRVSTLFSSTLALTSRKYPTRKAIRIEEWMHHWWASAVYRESMHFSSSHQFEGVTKEASGDRSD